MLGITNNLCTHNLVFCNNSRYQIGMHIVCAPQLSCILKYTFCLKCVYLCVLSNLDVQKNFYLQHWMSFCNVKS